MRGRTCHSGYGIIVAGSRSLVCIDNVCLDRCVHLMVSVTFGIEPTCLSGRESEQGSITSMEGRMRRRWLTCARGSA